MDRCNLGGGQCSTKQPRLVDKPREVRRIGQSRVGTTAANNQRIIRLHRHGNRTRHCRGKYAVHVQTQRGARPRSCQMVPTGRQRRRSTDSVKRRSIKDSKRRPALSGIDSTVGWRTRLEHNRLP